jgi:hypothetical protein
LKNVFVETIFFLMCRISSSSLSFSLSLSLWNQVEMEQERDQLALELDRVHAHGIDQTRSWRDMVAARDRQIVRLEDQLSKIAGSGDEAKRAAAQVLVRKLHEMRRNEEERVLAEANGCWRKRRRPWRVLQIQ